MFHYKLYYVSLISVILSLILSLRIIYQPYLLYRSHVYIFKYYTDNWYGLVEEPSPEPSAISETR